MNKIKNLFRTKRFKKTILIIVLLIILTIGITFIFSPTTKFINNLNKINGTSYNLEKNNRFVAYNHNCKVAVYPTKHLIERDIVQDTKNKHSLYLYADSAIDKDIAILVIPTTEADNDFMDRMNKITNVKQPKISSEYNTLNYFIYNERNYYYNINAYGGFMLATPINDKYLYWVMANYKNLTKEDIESILYFEII